MGIDSYSTTAATNSASPPNGWPEGMAPSAVNDTGRQMMADIRAWYETAEWINFGNVHAYAGGSSFTIGGGVDRTATYHVGRRVKAAGNLTGTIQGTISAASYSAPTNTVTVNWDSGTLQNETLTVYLHILMASSGIPAVVARSGVKLLFPGIAAAPIGWTIDTAAAYEHAAIRVRSSASASTGGTVDFATAFANGSTGSYTLQTADIPAHTHTGPSHTHDMSHTHNYDKAGLTANVPSGPPNQQNSVTSFPATATTAPSTANTGASGTGATGSTGGGGGHSHGLSLAVKYLDACVCVKI